MKFELKEENGNKKKNKIWLNENLVVILFEYRSCGFHNVFFNRYFRFETLDDCFGRRKSLFYNDTFSIQKGYL